MKYIQIFLIRITSRVDLAMSVYPYFFFARDPTDTPPPPPTTDRGIRGMVDAQKNNDIVEEKK